MVGLHRKTTRWQSTVAIAAAPAAPDSSLLTFRQGGARKPGVGDEAALNGMRFVWRTGIP